jgi:hypothetical protein
MYPDNNWYGHISVGAGMLLSSQKNQYMIKFLTFKREI